mgnify:CR=1 FL=1
MVIPVSGVSADSGNNGGSIYKCMMVADGLIVGGRVVDLSVMSENEQIEINKVSGFYEMSFKSSIPDPIHISFKFKDKISEKSMIFPITVTSHIDTSL